MTGLKWSASVFESMPKLRLAALTFFLLAAIGALDGVTGRAVSVDFFYLLPISLASWHLGKREALLTAAAADLVWLFSNRFGSGSPPGSTLLLWNALMRFGIFLVCAYALSSLRIFIAHLKEERSRSRQLAVRALTAQEDERRRIARELHDEASQALATLTLRIEEIRRKRGSTSQEEYEREMHDLKELTEQVLAELRELAFTLRPTLLDDLGLRHALASLFREQLKKKGIHVSLNFKGPEFRLPEMMELTLFRVAQEAVSNIVRHSGADQVSASLEWKPYEIRMEITDNGVGFEPFAHNPSEHLGIFGMRERVFLLSGSFTLESAPGRGTTVAALIPAAQNLTEKEAGPLARAEAPMS